MTVALDDAEEVLLDRALDAQRSRAVHFEVLEPEDARGREPALASSLRAAFAFPRDGVARAGRVAPGARPGGARGRGPHPRGGPGRGRLEGRRARHRPSHLRRSPPGRGRRPRLVRRPGRGRGRSPPSPGVFLEDLAEAGRGLRPGPARAPSRLAGGRPRSPARRHSARPRNGGPRRAATAGPSAGGVAALLSAVALLVPAAPAWGLRDLGSSSTSRRRTGSRSSERRRRGGSSSRQVGGPRSSSSRRRPRRSSPTSSRVELRPWRRRPFLPADSGPERAGMVFCPAMCARRRATPLERVPMPPFMEDRK